MTFKSSADFEKWLAKNHTTSTGIWLRMYRKKDVHIKSIKGPEALDVALCYGWITGQARADEISALWRFCPRRPKSIWSKINVGHVKRLIKEGRMKPAGFRQIEEAKKDGRWDNAYSPPSTATLPKDFIIELNKNKEAKAFMNTLSKTNRYSIIFRLQNTQNKELRKAKIKVFVKMLAEKRTFH